MPPGPDHLPTELPGSDYFSYTWSSLPWSPWVPFTATKVEFRQIPKEPGLYRIKPVGKDFLMYIGETRRTAHERLIAPERAAAGCCGPGAKPSSGTARAACCG